MSRRKSTKINERSITESLQEYGRGVAGALMFSLPLLDTMEVWWAGFNTHPTLILLGTVVTYAIALSSSALILWFFGRFDGVTMFTALAQTVALGLAATPAHPLEGHCCNE